MKPFWKPMPYYILREKNALNGFKRNNISGGVAALKVYIIICLFSNHNEDGDYCASLTYDQISKLASISRALVRKGLLLLSDLELISSKGKKKINYHLVGVNRVGKVYTSAHFNSRMGFWAKLPSIGLIDESGRIPAFEAMTNRSYLELNALRVFVYLLYIRSNGDVCISVSLAKISNKLGLPIPDILSSIGFLQSTGLLYKVNFFGNSAKGYDSAASLDFFTCGWEHLEWKPAYLSVDDFKGDVINNLTDVI